VIPARILADWDFNRYKACDAACKKIIALKEKPLLDVDEKLYDRVTRLKKIREFRLQASQMAPYIYTCPQSEYLVGLWRERIHLLQNDDKYSLTDLIDIKQGRLVAFVHTVLQKTFEHIRQCQVPNSPRPPLPLLACFA